MVELENYTNEGKTYLNYHGVAIELDPNIIIATRHRCIYEWFISKGIYGIWMPVVRNTDVRGKIICGANLPLHIVGFAKKAIIINIKNDTDKEFEKLTPLDIDNCFHQVQLYEVEREKLDIENEDKIQRIIRGDINAY